jgi:prepilin-type N-terminal cleavage/methylation domain-containing protein
VHPRRPHASAEHGFTIVEVMVAMVVLVVGLIGAAAMLGTASEMTASSKAREGGVALQRELVEAARGTAYAELAPTGIVAKLQALQGLADTGAQAGWNITRRSVQYTVAVGVCSVDDTADGLAAHPAGSFCANGGGTATSSTCRDLLGVSGSIKGTAAAASAGATAGDCGIDLDVDGEVDNLVNVAATACPGACATPDTNPEDYKRVVTLVRWKTGSGSRFALQSTTLPNPGLSGAPRVTTLTFTPSATTVTSASTGSLAFTATTNRTASTVGWSLDGTPKGPAAGTDTNSFTFTWNLGTVSSGAAPGASEVVDGEYTVGAKAFDEFGAYGPQKVQTIVLNRRAPYAPPNFRAVMVDDAIEAAWTWGPERDLHSYRLYRRSPDGQDAQVADTAERATQAVDAASLPSSGTWSYFARAVDRDASGNPRTGDVSPLIAIPMDNRSPAEPTNVTAQRVSGRVELTWSAPTAPADPDAGDSVTGYVVYRDGQKLADAYATTTGTSYSDSAVTDGSHTYWVVAVDSRGAQSARVLATEVVS